MRPARSVSSWVIAGLLGIVAISLAWGGGTEHGAQGIFLMALGCLMAIFPPRTRPLAAFVVLAAGLLVVGAMTWLPAACFATPPWRMVLMDVGIALPGTLSPQPWLSLEAWVLLAAGALFVCWLSGWEWPKVERILLLRMMAAGTIFFAAAALWFFLYKTPPTFWHGPRGFGPFPNRNQTGDVLGTGGILILAMVAQSWRYKGRTWPLWIAGFALVLYATIENSSRAGVGLLLGGTACWIALAGWISRTPKWLVIGLSATGILASLFLLFGNATLQRFQTESINENGQMLGFRGQIYRDVVHMINAGPVCGIGLGNFRAVFPFYRVASRLETTTLHPESDWLWAGSELGWGGLALLLAGTIVWCRRCWPFEADGEARCRAAAFVAFTGFLLHGIVDVSGHRLGSVMPALLLASLAMRRETRPAIGRAGALCFRLAGGAVVAAGVIWISHGEAKSPGKSPRPAPSVVVRVDTDALQRAPLDGESYFSRAAARAQQGDWLGAIADFRIARALQPIFIHRAVAEGRVWCSVQPMLALPAWQDALARCPPERRPAVYAQILADAPAIPLLREKLRQLAESDPLMQVEFLQAADPVQTRDILDSVRTADPRLENLDDAGKLAVFKAWLKYGDAETWERGMEEIPGWQNAGWRLLARRVAERGDLKRACRLAIDNLPRPIEPPKSASSISPTDLQRRLLLNPKDYAAAWQLSLSTDPGDATASLDLLHRVCRLPGTPPYFRHALARRLVAREDWPAAWAILQTLL